MRIKILVLCLMFVFAVLTYFVPINEPYAEYKNVVASIELFSARNSVLTTAAPAPAQFNIDSLLDIELLGEVMIVAWINHVNRLNFDKNKITKSIVRGFMQGLDKHSHFLDMKETEIQIESLSGEMKGGIGINFLINKRYIFVAGVFKNSPAEKAGVKIRDKIVEINGIPIRNFKDEDISKLIRGEVGTNVNLKIIRRGENNPIYIPITRSILTVQSVYCELVNKSGKKFGIVHIDGFNENTYLQFVSETSELMKKRPDYIVFDLRDDPGGFVNIVCDIMSDIVGLNKVILQEERPDSKIKKFYSYRENGFLTNKDSSVKKMACLVNGGTASAAEIMASGLRDILGVKIVGEATYGKGTGWSSFALASGKGTCNVTCFNWLTPSGKSINEVGIDPDIEVFMDEEDVLLKKDPQMDAAFEELLKK